MLTFSLTYRGDMLLPQQRGITEEKHKLRLEFHGQLMKMWKQSLVLKSINPEDLERVVENGKDGRRFDVTRNAEGKVKLYQDTPLRGFMYQRKLQGYRFVPLITETMETHCHLAITFRRPMKPKSIIYAGGDLDGRLKTLFDALAMPPKSQNLPDGVNGNDELCLCLLEDDELITGFSVESKELLGNYPSGRYSELDIDVEIHGVTHMFGTRELWEG